MHWLRRWIGGLGCVALAMNAMAQDLPPPRSLTAAVPQDVGSRRAEVPRLRLRLQWGGGESRTWQGALKLVRGQLVRSTPLSMGIDSAATACQRGNEIRIDHWSASDYGGVDLEIADLPDTQFQLELTSREDPQQTLRQTFDLSDCLTGAISGAVDDTGNQFTFQRLDWDSLCIQPESDEQIFRPGQRFRFQWRPWRTSMKSMRVQGRVELRAAGRARPLVIHHQTFQLDEEGSAEFESVELEMPREEGVYQVECTLQPAWYQTSLASRKAVIQRQLELVVLDDTVVSVEAPQDLRWETIATIAPRPEPSRNSLWPSRLGRRSWLGNHTQADPQHSDRLRLEVGGWQAVPLNVGEPGQPHLVEIDYVQHGPLSLGISLLEADEQGQVPLFGFDSGITIPHSLVTDPWQDTLQTHRMLVWPTQRESYLLLANRHAQQPVTVGQIRVLAGPEQLAAVGNRTDTPPGQRGVLALIESPLLARSLGAAGTFDPQSQQQLDDWQAILVAAQRLVQQLKFNGYRGAYLQVVGDGSAIYPSSLLQPSPRYDSGVFFSDGRFERRKDILELLLRLFQREGLELVPLMTFNGPLPELEQQRPLDGTPAGFDLVDMHQGRAAPGIREGLPLYNPLDPAVQRAVTRVLEEFADRYAGRFPSMREVAISCRPDTCLLLPGRQWGYDETTLARFAQAQPDWEQTTDPEQRRQRLLQGDPQAWLQWRADQMADWYYQLTEVLLQRSPELTLVLAPMDLYQNAELATALAPNLYRSSDFERLMVQVGLNPGRLSAAAVPSNSLGQPALRVLNPHRLAPDRTAVQERANLAAENSSQSHAFFQSLGHAAELFHFRESWAHFEQLQAETPFAQQRGALLRRQPLRPGNQFARQRLVEAVAQRDARQLVDGGTRLSTACDPSWVAAVRTFSRLPDQPFADVPLREAPESTSLPLAVRQLTTGPNGLLYLANASPWPVHVRLNFSQPGRPLAESLLPLDSGPLPLVEAVSGQPAPEESTLLRIEPFELWAGQLAAGTAVTSYDYSLPAEAVPELRKQIYALRASLELAQQAAPIEVLVNSRFEREDAEPLAGWNIGQQDPRQFQVLEQSAVPAAAAPDAGPAGSRLLRMTNLEGRPVWIRSQPFMPPVTGRVSISVWLRTSEPQPPQGLRLALEGQTEEGNYYRFGSLSASGEQRESNAIEGQWKRFAVHFDDLPVASLPQVRIGLDLMGSGSVDIADIRVYDRWYDANDARAVTQLLASAEALLMDGHSLERCRRLLHGYWAVFLREFVVAAKPVPPPPIRQPESGETPASASSGPVAESAQRKVPMFRRFREFVPGRGTINR